MTGRYVQDEDRVDARPARPNGTAVLIVAGSSGRMETARAELLASQGVHARTIRWFGGAAQRPAPHEVPLEIFAAEAESLRHHHDRVVLMGTSFGSEAVLLTASAEPVDAVIAIAPSSVVWPGLLDGGRSSHWTRDGRALAAVPFDGDWTPETDPPAFRSLYERSLAAHERAAAAGAESPEIPVERIDGEVLLVHGGDDRVWPSDAFAQRIVRRRRAAGLDTAVIAHPDAGHRLVLPGERPPAGGTRMQRGGSEAADRALGLLAWPRIRDLLRIRAL